MKCDLDASIVVTFSGAGEAIRLWNVKSGEKMASYVLGHGTEFSSLFLGQAGHVVAFTPDENCFSGRLCLYKVSDQVRQELMGVTADGI